MDILEHPLEAVAFRLYSLPDTSGATGAAAWTCIAAVLTAAAAAGLWRLRSCAPAAYLKPLELEPSKSKEISQNTAGSSARSSPDSAASTAAAPSPKERYTAYYSDSGRVGCCDVEDDEENEAEEQDEDDEEGGVHYQQTSETVTDPFGWEEVVRSLPLSPTTATEMGRHRSPTALSGSVVRLWDEAVVDASVAAAWSPRRSSRHGLGVLN